LGVFALARRFIPAGTKLKKSGITAESPENAGFFGISWISPEISGFCWKLLDFPGQGM